MPDQADNQNQAAAAAAGDAGAAGANASAGKAEGAASTQGASAEVKAPDAKAIRAAALAEFDAQLKTLTGAANLDALGAQRKTDDEAKLKADGEFQKLAEQRQSESAGWQAKYRGATVQSALVAAASRAGAVDADTVQALLAATSQVDDQGVVTVGGKPVDEAVKQLLVDKPFLARAAGQGSGSPGSAGQTDVKAKIAEAKKAGNVAEVLRLQRESQAQG